MVCLQHRKRKRKRKRQRQLSEALSMASKLVPLRRLWRLSKLPPLSSLSSCSNYNSSQNPHLLEDSSRRFDRPSFASRRSFSSRPSNLDVEATSQGPAAIDYRYSLFNINFYILFCLVAKKITIEFVMKFSHIEKVIISNRFC